MPGNDISRLSRFIRAHFGDGLTLGTATVQQVDSAFGCLSPQEMKARLADAGDCENSTLVHLIFSPDRPTQIRLEPMLGQAAWPSEEVAALQQELIDARLQTTLRFDDGRRDVVVAIPAEGVAVFVAGLHMDRCIPDSVAGALDDHLPDHIRLAIRVALRNARIAWHPTAVDFLCRLFQRASLLEPDLQDCLGVAVSLLTAANENTDLFRRLETLKMAHARRLRQAEASQTALKHSNTESLMLSGSRLFQIDPRETLHCMACIDAVALAVFNRLPAGLGAVQTLELDGRRDSRDVLQRVGRLFQ